MVKPRGPFLRLTMLDLAKIVVACSAASACITPTFRLVQAGVADPWSMAVVDAIIVPLVFVLACYVMVRSGPRRDAMVAGLILFAVSVVLAIVARSIWPIVDRFVHHGLRGIRPMEYPVLTSGLLTLAILGGCVTWLGFRLRRLARLDPPPPPGATDHAGVKSPEEIR